MPFTWIFAMCLQADISYGDANDLGGAAFQTTTLNLYVGGYLFGPRWHNYSSFIRFILLCPSCDMPTMPNIAFYDVYALSLLRATLVFCRAWRTLQRHTHCFTPLPFWLHIVQYLLFSSLTNNAPAAYFPTNSLLCSYKCAPHTAYLLGLVWPHV